jgi:hypothetical protein
VVALGEAEAPVNPRRQRADPEALGVAIALVGVALGIVAAWLPLVDSESYRRAHPGEPVDDELLGQTATGLLLVGAVVACAASAALAFRGRRTTWGPMIAGVAAIVLATLAGLRHGVLVAHFGAAHGTPGPGLGVYAGLVAGLLMLVGGLLMRRSSRTETLVIASAAGALVAACAWWLAGLSERAPAVGGVALLDGGVELRYPNDGTTPEERRQVGYDTCASQRLGALARSLGTRASADAVARGYARYFGTQGELYEGCLQAFRER